MEDPKTRPLPLPASISQQALYFLNSNLNSRKHLDGAPVLLSELQTRCDDLDRVLSDLALQLRSNLTRHADHSNRVDSLFVNVRDQLQDIRSSSTQLSSDGGSRRVMVEELQALAKEVARVETVRNYAETALKLDMLVGDIEDAVSSSMNSTLRRQSSTKNSEAMRSVALKHLKSTEDLLSSVSKTHPEWNRLVSAVDHRIDRALAILRPQAIADHRALLASLGWPPPLSTLSSSTSDAERSNDVQNPLFTMKGDLKLQYCESFLALCGLQELQRQRKYRQLGGHYKDVALHQPLWSIEELVNPISVVSQRHFSKWIEKPEYIFALVYKITRDYVDSMDDLLQPLVDEAMLSGYSCREEWIFAMVSSLSTYLAKEIFPMYVDQLNEESVTGIRTHARLSWLHLVDLMIAFDKRVHALAAHSGVLLSLQEDGDMQRLSSLTVFCDRPDWLDLWADIERREALRKLKSQMEDNKNWLSEDQGVTLLPDQEDNKSPLISSAVLQRISSVIDRCRSLPSTSLRSRFVKLTGSPIIHKFLDRLLLRCQEAEGLTALTDDDALTKVALSVNAARYFESVLKEWCEYVFFLEMGLNHGDKLDEEDDPTATGAPGNGIFDEEIERLNEFRIEWVEKLSTVVLRGFDALCRDYIKNKKQWQEKSEEASAQSRSYLTAMDYLHGKMSILEEGLNRIDFTTVWRSLAAGIDKLIFHGLFVGNLKFYNWGVESLSNDLMVLFGVFGAWCSRPQGFFPKISEGLKLLKMANNHVNNKLMREERWLKENGIRHLTAAEIIDNILGGQYQIPWEKQQIESLVGSMACFHDFFARSWKKRSRVARCLERKIRDAAHKAEDVIESYISEHFLAENGGEKLEGSEFISELVRLVEEIKSIQLKVTRLMDSWAGAEEDLRYTHFLPLASSGDYTMIGLQDDSLQLMDRVVGQQSEKLLILPVVGMGGIGKTTLVKNVFKKSIEYPFDVAAWITVSHNYRARDILLGLLESMRRLTNEMLQESDEKLSDCLYKCLKGRRYLIVMDNIWHKQAWDKVKRLFPDDNIGSRVLLTTRESDVATYANSSCHEHHLMRPLNENESWDLLRFKIFGDEERCPAELEKVGQKIARSCKGLPLSIVVISGVLSRAPKTLVEWEPIAKDIYSVLLANGSKCAELLNFSYDRLPHHLKACFLYMGVFPLDSETPISKLITLWVAEGFIKSNCLKSLEEVGEEYFDDLMSANLISVGERRLGGKVKTFVVHDLVREWCLSRALEEKFIHTLNANIYNCQEVISDARRLCILKDSSDETQADIHETIGTFPLIRSLLSQSNPQKKLRCCKLLRVLDLSKVDLADFPRVILDLVHLRYVSLCFKQEQEIYISEDLPDSLRNLQVLIINQRCINSSVHLPQGIWRMPHLRHLQLGKCYFPHPQEGDKNPVLKNLQTLAYVSGWCCMKEFIQGIPNVKKLGIRFEVVDERRVHVSSIRHLGKLHKLEILKCIVEPGSYDNIAMDLTLPRNLKRLTLTGTRISWKEMSIVGSLPNLEILKLKDHACEGSEWEPVEGEFCRLKLLHIDGSDLQHWRAEKEHFPILEHLFLFECKKLEEIPFDFVSLETLERIELDDASPSAVASALQIQAEQQDLGNEVKVCIHEMWQCIDQKREMENKRKEEIERRRIEAEYRRRAEEEERRLKQCHWEEYKSVPVRYDFNLVDFYEQYPSESRADYESVPVWYVDEGTSYEQYPPGRRGDDVSPDTTGDASDHQGGETSTSVQEDAGTGSLLAILAAGLAGAWIYMCNR
ncbi:hypothetical protein F511_02229 [Dorcoceras hygrometricum]|uniref:Uncharacterized protein n=1 Tax=Dorcoceras hygrometricum TaxID=472368 RepID=A0A2Z7API3_9LAMI|nr:hypothetical protein F511_02229 [Dorcoceras hygrometricum]